MRMHMCSMQLLNVVMAAMLAAVLMQTMVGASLLMNEAQALMAFKAGISTDPLGVLESWHVTSNASSPCSQQAGKGGSAAVSTVAWTGIACDPSSQRVISVNLSSCNLSGSISPALAFLPALSTLDLSNNLLHGNLSNTLFIDNSPLQYLDLSYNELEGELPHSLANLSALRFLDLSTNKFAGEMPSSLGQLRNLRVLWLEDTGLQGSIPSEIWQLPSLEELAVVDSVAIAAIDTEGEHFRLSAQLPSNFSFCPSIQILKLDGVHLAGAIPSSLGQCTSLEELDLSHGSIQGTIPDSWQNLTNLQFFFLQGNNLTGEIPPSLSGCSQLEALKLGENLYLSGTIPMELGRLAQLQHVSLAGPMSEALCNCTQLAWLDLSWSSVQSGMDILPDCIASLAQLRLLGLHFNVIHGEVLRKALTNLTQLYYLDIAWAQIYSGIPHEVGNLTHLQHLAIERSNITGSIPTGIAQLPLLEMIDFSTNNLAGEVPSGLGALGKLEWINFSTNKLLSGPFPKDLDNCSSLQHLQFLGNNLSGDIEHFDFSKLPQLQIFSVQQNNITGRWPSSLMNSPNLILFDVQLNKLTGPLSSSYAGGEIKGLSNLRVLLMSYNNLDGTIPDWIWKLPKLQVLDLSNNHFSGAMPTTVSTLTYFKQPHIQDTRQSNLYMQTRLTIKSKYMLLSYILSNILYIDVSQNDLGGEISESFGQLLGLTNLNLSHNHIGGRIPVSLGRLVNLDELDLSHNNLTGGIPQELASVGGLSAMDLSYNNLQGPIPTINSFNTRFGAASFAHNPLLCGAPLSRTCSSGLQAHSSTKTLRSEPDQNVLDRIGRFASPWGLLIGYVAGFLGVLYLLHYAW